MKNEIIVVAAYKRLNGFSIERSHPKSLCSLFLEIDPINLTDYSGSP
jgi:hypothetical protein